MNKTEIYVARHAQSGFNAGLDYREFDSHLTELGIEQARKRARDLADVPFDAYYASTLARTIETADIIKGAVDLPIQTDPTINERSIYTYAQTLGTDVASVEEDLANAMREMNDDEKLDFRLTPEMESSREGGLRLLGKIEEIAKERVGNRILIASHSNLMRSVLTLLGFAKYDQLPVRSIDNTGYFVLQTADGKKFDVTKTTGINLEEGKVRYW